tara:strand:+ start:1939 stop:2070 length:132 start_codon:yes stop_codon:yes gene_type:complete
MDINKIKKIRIISVVIFYLLLYNFCIFIIDCEAYLNKEINWND